MVFAGLVFYYLVEEAIEIKTMGLEYFQSFWNVMDICVIGVSLSNINYLKRNNNFTEI